MPKVFISYSQESEVHEQRVCALADRLRHQGVSIILDRDYNDGGPDGGWNTWCEKNAGEADIVLLVFTPTYRKCWDGEQPRGVRQGATLETKVLHQRLNECGAEIDFCRAVTFENDHKNYIPKLIAGHHTFDANRDFLNILAWLRRLGALPEYSTSNINIVWPEPVADYPWSLADRTEPFELFHEMITARRSERIFLVDGSSSSGKTVLLTELIKFAKQLGLLSVQLDLKGCPTLDELFDTLTLEVDATLLPAFHSANGPPRKTALLKDLEKLPKPLVLGFDTYQDVPLDIADWIEGQLLRRMEHCPGLVVILSGKQVPERTCFPWAGLAVHTTLPAIKEAKHWIDFATHALGHSSISNDHIEMLLHISQGDPGQTSALLRSFSRTRG